MNTTLTPAATNSFGPMPGVSANYQFMPTTSIISIMENNGFEVTKCMQGRSRTPEGGMYAKHRVHFRKRGQDNSGEISPEIILINSHNRGAALRFLAGYIRFICENGLVAGDVLSDTNKIYHTNRNPFDLVLDRAEYTTQLLDSKLEVIKDMRQMVLSPAEKEEFAVRASNLNVFKNKVFNNPLDLLTFHRREDIGDTVWNIFNRIQENVKQGNAFITSVTGKTRKMRPVRSLDTDIKYNQELWNLAESYVS